jgi:hypothetical protein
LIRYLGLASWSVLERSLPTCVALLAEAILDEATELHKEQEAVCLEFGNRDGLAYCYWNWGLLAREHDDSKTEREKLERALALFTELKMPGEIKAVQESLDETNGNPPNKSGHQ